MKAEAIAVIRKLDRLGRGSNPTSLYQKRLSSNVHGRRRKSTKGGAWEGILIGILTTQQRSTERTNLTRDLLDSKVLRWPEVVARPALIGQHVQGFNYNRRKRQYLEGAVTWLDENWNEVRRYQQQIINVPSSDWKARYPIERDASDFLSEGITGIGQKQARNFWQHRGYSAWTIPLDSRIKTILESSPFVLDMSGRYEDIEWEVIQLCRQARTYPCLLDATLFNLEGFARGLVGLPVE